MQQINNLKYLKSTRKKLRNEATDAEKLLWNSLKHRQLAGHKFRRQHSIDRYILDFYCPQHKLAIELDGGGHFTQTAIDYDEQRTAFLNSLEIQVLRFTNEEIMKNLGGALERIKEILNHPPTASFSRRGS